MHSLNQQGLVFLFVIVLVAIGRFSRYQRTKLWHETARLALEKGQPLPPRLPGGRGYGSGRSALGRGLILIAIGAGLYYALPPDSRAWAALPAFIGAAYLIIALISTFRQDGKSADAKTGNSA